MKKEVIATTNAPGAVGPYVQAIKAMAWYIVPDSWELILQPEKCRKLWKSRHTAP